VQEREVKMTLPAGASLPAPLHDAALHSTGPETPFVAGHLAGAFDADRMQLRDRWPRVWKRVVDALR